MATAEVVPMLDAAAVSAPVEDVAIPSLDEATHTPTTEETPALEAEGEPSKLEAKTEDGKPVLDKDGKPVAAEKTASEIAASTTPAKMAEALKNLKATDPVMAKALHEHASRSLQTLKFLKDVGAKDFAEAKSILSKPDEATEQFRASVEASDQLLYQGGEAHKELVENIAADLAAEIGSEAPARLSEFGEHIIDKIKTADPAGHARIQRAAFLDASESSGLIESLNKLNAYIAGGRNADAKELLGEISKFYKAEIEAEQGTTKDRTDAQATAKTTSAAAVQALRTETTKEVNSATNKLLGSYLTPFLQKQLKGLSRPELEKVASEIHKDAHAALGKDGSYVKNMSTKYDSMKTQRQQRELLKVYEEKLKSGFGKAIVESTVKRLYPSKFIAAKPAVKPVAPKAPVSTKVTIGGASQTVFQLEKRPTNLVRSDTMIGNRLYTTADLELLQLGKGMGVVKTKTGHAFVCWRKK